MASLALAFDILAKDRASSVFKGVGDEADRAGKKGAGFGSGIAGGLLKAGAALGGLALVKDAFSTMISEARESAQVGRLTDAVLKSTGGAAKITAAQVGDLATAISNKTGIDDEAVQAGENLLLTFTNVRNEAGKGNDVFNQTTQAAVDMSAALGTDLKGSTIQLGKALNDPVKGLSKLTKSGVTFTQQQKDQVAAMVKSGNTLGAQKVILAEVNKEFGGAAAAASDPLQRLKVVALNLAEAAGLKLLPAINGFANFVADKAIPAIEALAGWLGPKIGAVIGAVKGWFAGLSGSGAGVTSAFSGIVAFVQTQLIPRFNGIVTAVQGFVSVALPIVQSFVAGMQARIAPLLPTIRSIFGTIGQIVAGAMELVRAVIERVTSVISFIWSHWGTQIMNVVGAAFRGALAIIKPALELIRNVIKTVTALIHGDWAGVWDGLKSIVSSAWGVIKGVVSSSIGVVKSVLSLAWSVIKTGASAAWNGIKAGVSAAWEGIKSAISTGIGNAVGLVKALPGKILSALGNLNALLLSSGQHLIQGLIDGIMSKIEDVGRAAGKVADKIKGFFGGSPVEEGPLLGWNNGGVGKNLAGMLAQGLIASKPLVASASAQLAGSLAVKPSAAGVSAGGSRSSLSPADIRALAAAMSEAVRDGAFAGTSGGIGAQTRAITAGAI